MNKKRLLKLADFLETVPRKAFLMVIGFRAKPPSQRAISLVNAASLVARGLARRTGGSFAA